MAWVTFTADFLFHVTARSSIAYKAGMTVSVVRRCADEAVAAGVAKAVKAPSRGNKNGAAPT